jgi:homoserine kinase type II
MPAPKDVRRPAGGTNNSVFLLDESYVLRIYDNLDAGQIAAEHRLLADLNAWHDRADLPFAVPAPLPTMDGRTTDGSAALFPYVAGRPADYNRLGEIELAGEALGVLDGVLAELSDTLPPREWNGRFDALHPAVDDIAQLYDELDRSMPGDPGVAWFGDHAARTERAYLAVVPTLPAQIIHGDFALSNVLVHDGRVAAVLDFEVARTGPRVDDPVAAIGVTTRFGTPGDLDRLAALRRGYARAVTLSPAEEAAIPTLLRNRALQSAVWRAGRWRLGLAGLDEVRHRLERGVELERWLARPEFADLWEV